MASRLELQTKLETILGSRNVYFQPPASIKMKYPAIVYNLNDLDSRHANNGVYLLYKEYSIILIDRDPDSKIVEKIAGLPTCQFDRYYTSENLNHWSFSLYF